MKVGALTVSSATACAILCSSAAFAEAGIPISACQFMQSYGPDVYSEKHNDIGAGFVMYAERSEFGTLTFVADCFSGSTLKVETSPEQDSVDVEEYVRSKASSSEKVTLPMLRSHFSSLGFGTDLKVETLEHCACASFYPEAKGDKGHWQRRYAHP